MKESRGKGFAAFAFIVLLAGIFALFVGLVLWYRGTVKQEIEERAKEAFENVKDHAPSTRTWDTEALDSLDPDGTFHFKILRADEEAASEEAETKPDPAAQTEALSPYDAVLKRYEEACVSGWKDTGSVSPLWYGEETEVNMELAGYELKDLNMDGSDELLVSARQEAPYNSLILDLYTVKNQTAQKVLSSDEKSTWFLCKDNRLLFYTSDGEGTAKVALYALDKATGKPVAEEVLLRDGITYPEYEALYSDKKGYDPKFYDKDLSETMDPLMGESANVVYDRLTGLRTPLELTSF